MLRDIPILIGSTAYQPPIPREEYRTPGDWDIMGTTKAIHNFTQQLTSSVNGKILSSVPISGTNIVTKIRAPSSDKLIIVDATIAISETSDYDVVEYVQEMNSKPSNLRGVIFYIASPTVCWMLKESHKYKDSVHFLKTRRDVLNMRADFHKYQSFSPKLQTILEKRELETYRKPINLNVSKDEFFANDGVHYVYDHDWLHSVCAVKNVPAYTYISSDGSEVKSSHQKFMSVSEELQKLCVYEEALVIALERGVFPFKKIQGVSLAELARLYDIALQKICTTLTSGWFRQYAWENYDELNSKSEFYSNLEKQRLDVIRLPIFYRIP